MDVNPQLVKTIALVGIGCRFPGNLNTPKRFWDALVNGRDCVRAIPEDRWNIQRFWDPSPLKADRIVSRRGGFIDNLGMFDARFFGISPREAEGMDPQQRHFLEVAYEALEDAGINPDELDAQDVGVFVGASSHDYWDLHQRSSSADIYTNTGKASSLIANRLSYVFNLKGPSLVVDTACSSSLAAVHLACQSILNGESSIAIVGGVSLIINPNLSIGFSRAGMLSPDGASKPFDSTGNGYVRSEGVGAVILMPLAEAEARNLDVYALVKGTMINQDGKTPGLTHPSEDAQKRLLHELYQRLGIEPAALGYVEAHGTGTVVGDRIELRALGSALGQKRPPGSPLRIGSVKGNLGHLEAASGIAGLIKVALCLRNRRWVSSLHFSSPPSGVSLEALNLEVGAVPRDWKSEPGSVLAGINSFGFGGTNAHAVLMDCPRRPEAPAPDPGARLPFPVTAESPASLVKNIRSIRTFLAGHPRASCRDLSHTLCKRRRHHRIRKLFWASSLPELEARLRACHDALAEQEAGRQRSSTARVEKTHPLTTARYGATGARRAEDDEDSAAPPPPHAALAHTLTAPPRVRIAFVLSGQGGQWAGMARALMRESLVFRDAVAECDRVFQPLAGWSIADLLMNERAGRALSETRYAQPALFAVQTALAAWWRALGVAPDMLVGHSVGEVAAAHLAGVYSLKDAVTVVYHRSRLQQQTSQDCSMLAVGASAAAVSDRLARYSPNTISVAANNGPTSITLAGLRGAIEDLSASLTQASVFNRILDIKHAFHSPFMDPIEDALCEALKGLEPRRAATALYSTVTGGRSSGEEWDEQYWWRNVRQTVSFAEAIRAMKADVDGEILWIELGAQPLLKRPIQETYGPSEAFRYIATLRREAPESLLEEAIEQAFAHGVPLHWPSTASTGAPLKLPTYAWDWQHLWSEPLASKLHRLSKVNHPWMSLVNTSESDWTVELSTASAPLLRDHGIDEAAVFPGAGYLDLILSVPLKGAPASKLIEDVTFRQPLRIPSTRSISLMMKYDPTLKQFTFTSSREGQTHTPLHCHGRYRELPSLTPPAPISIQETIASFQRTLPPRHVYTVFSEMGLSYGPCFQGLREIYLDGDRALAKVVVDGVLDERFERHPFHPSYLDACFQASLLTLKTEERDPATRRRALPIALKSCEVYGRPTPVTWVHASLVRQSSTDIEVDLLVYDDAGNPIARLRGFRCHILAEPLQGRPAAAAYRERWQQQSQGAARVEGKLFLVVAEAPSVSHLLERELGASNRVLHVLPNDSPAQDGDDVSRVEREEGDAFDRVLTALSQQDETPEECLFFAAERTSPDPAVNGATRSCLTLFRLARALAKQKTPPRLTIFTQRAQLVEGHPMHHGTGDAMLWGLGRVVTNELPGLRCRLVDLETLNGPDVAAALSDTSREDEIAYREGRPYVRRLEECPPDERDPRSAPARVIPGQGQRRFRLLKGSNRLIEGVFLQEEPRRAPGSGEVEIQVKAAAINFRDVMKIMGIYPTEDPRDVHLGDECSGVVSRVGEGVDLAPGDEVIALAPGAFASHVTVPRSCVFEKSKRLTFEEAAGLPIAGATARYALSHLARLEAGQRILIHAAAGGVGLAATQLAMMLGAEVIATAGTEEKRDYLRGLGVKHVFDSRRLDFKDQVLDVTKNAGVDVVLNSIAGDALEKSLELLAPFGHFIEIGKVDIYKNTPLGMRNLRHNASFHAVDLTALLARKPALVREIVEVLLTLVESGRLAAPRTESFCISNAAKALKHVSQSKHIGKVVLTVPAAPVEVRRMTEAPDKIRPDATYVVTGGYKGFGFETARWLVDHGARTLVLVGESGVAPEQTRVEIDAVRARGVHVEVAACDLSRGSEVARLFEAIRSRLPPIRGIFHAAMKLRDGLITSLSDSSFSAVLGPKVLGAWHLHAQSLPDPIDYFVCYSSISGLMGNIGQSAYAAANVYLDAFSQYRRQLGLPALTVSYGVIGEVGYAARHPEVKASLMRQGFRDMSPRTALAALGSLLNRQQVNGIVADIDWKQLASCAPRASTSPRFSAISEPLLLKHAADAALSEKLSSLGPPERRALLQERLIGSVAEILRVHPSSIGAKTPLQDLGLDSLAALELKNRIYNDLRVDVSAADFVDTATILTMTELVLQRHHESRQGRWPQEREPHLPAA
ncbi:type I polyketide synthase [Sorangium sp. So ce542]|uniref:type I polyketide synthase n=1 Tax=Sorangium sp. So ce542 TaxID=3133316 RepID=UPI003F5FCEFC